MANLERPTRRPSVRPQKHPPRLLSATAERQGPANAGVDGDGEGYQMCWGNLDTDDEGDGTDRFTGEEVEESQLAAGMLEEIQRRREEAAKRRARKRASEAAEEEKSCSTPAELTRQQLERIQNNRAEAQRRKLQRMVNGEGRAALEGQLREAICGKRNPSEEHWEGW